MVGPAVVNVALGSRSYPVVIHRGDPEALGERFAELFSAERAVVVTDANVGPLWADAVQGSLLRVGVRSHRITLAAGETHKTLLTWQHLVTDLLDRGVHRGTPVLAVGGGVVGDVAGFAAASVLRGIPYVQVPTSLLAMVDSSVGGKTAVNHPNGKNLVGAFYQPQLVFASLQTLTTLPPRELRAGLAEVVKTALLGDANLFATLEREAQALVAVDLDTLMPVISRCVEIKATVVAADERETGRRAVLNLGHTVGHGLEAAAGYGTLLHGEAVGLGLLAEARWAVKEGICLDVDLPNRLTCLLQRLKLPTTFPAVDRATLRDKMAVDKKVIADIVTLPMPRGVGDVELVQVSKRRLAELVPEP